MLTASITLFALSVLVPNLVLALRPSGEITSRAILGQLPNFSFALVLASFVLGVAYLFDWGPNWSIGMLLYLAFEAACLISTVVLFQMKEAQKARLLKDAMARQGAPADGSIGSGATDAVEIADTKAMNCRPFHIHDTGTPDASTGWTVSSLLSWHVYVYRLQVRFSVQTGVYEVTAEAETYDANWLELYFAGIGLVVPGAQLAAILAGASIQHSYYHAVQTAHGAAICLEGEGGCVILANADPAIAAMRHNEVSAAALIVATRISPKVMQFQLSGMATMSGHSTVQGITAGAAAGATTPVPGPLTNPTTGGSIPITLNAGVNVGITIVPSPTAVQNLPAGRSIIVECRNMPDSA